MKNEVKARNQDDGYQEVEVTSEHIWVKYEKVDSL